MKTKKPQPTSTRLEFLKQLKELGVSAYNEGGEAGWSVQFEGDEDEKDEKAGVVGFTAPPFVDLNPAAQDAARAARLEALATAKTLTGVDPTVIAEVETAAARFELESGLADIKAVELRKRLETSKTSEERLHFEQLLASHTRDQILYAHS